MIYQADLYIKSAISRGDPVRGQQFLLYGIIGILIMITKNDYTIIAEGGKFMEGVQNVQIPITLFDDHCRQLKEVVGNAAQNKRYNIVQIAN